MRGTRLVLLAVVILVGTITSAAPTDEQKAIKPGMVAEAVKKILGKIIASPVFNPQYNINNVSININTGATKLSGMINGAVLGIPDIELTYNQFTIIGFKHTVELALGKLTVSGDYDLNGVLAGILLIDAGGPIVVELEDVTAKVVVKLMSRPDNRIEISDLIPRDVTVELTLGKFHVDIENFLGELSEQFNDMVNEIAPEVITLYQPQIEGLIGGLLFDVIDGLWPTGATAEVDPARVTAALGEALNRIIEAAVENLGAVDLSSILTM